MLTHYRHRRTPRYQPSPIHRRRHHRLHKLQNFQILMMKFLGLRSHLQIHQRQRLQPLHRHHQHTEQGFAQCLLHFLVMVKLKVYCLNHLHYLHTIHRPLSLHLLLLLDRLHQHRLYHHRLM